VHPTEARLCGFATGALFLFFVLLSCTLPAGASPLTNALDDVAPLDLARHPTWLKLLHFEGRLPESVVLTADFFLSPNGKNDPQDELRATLEAYFLPWPQDTDKHPRCRFPARYYWLSRQIPLPGYALKDPRCRRLSSWALVDRVKSVSLLLVSGYLGNPASTFGHALLKLNTDSSDDDYGLFDLTLNYGALIPPNENALRYVVRGLFGGYEAGFSDRYFYTQDLVYSHTEFRDIWEYRLSLSDPQRTLLILHIWEIIGRKFVYYFLTRNCALRLAELVDLVVDDLVPNRQRWWYLPVQSFHRLNAIDREMSQAGKGGLVEAVRFIPSSKRVLAHRMQLLTKQEIKAINAVHLNGPSSLEARMEGFSEARQSVVLDSLLAYHKYRFMSGKGEDSQELREIKRGALLARLRLPARRRLAPNIPLLPSPADGSQPMVSGISVGGGAAHQDPFLRLTWSPFKLEAVGRNSMEGGELVLLDFAVGLSRDRQDIFLDQIDLIRISSLNTLRVPLAGENPLSWQLRVGTQRVAEGSDTVHDGTASFGIGYAGSRNTGVIGYAMTDLAVHTLAPYARLRPHLGLNAQAGGFRAWAYAGVESANYRGDFRAVWGGKLQVSLSRRFALHAEFSNERATRAAVGTEINW